MNERRSFTRNNVLKDFDQKTASNLYCPAKVNCPMKNRLLSEKVAIFDSTSAERNGVVCRRTPSTVFNKQALACLTLVSKSSIWYHTRWEFMLLLCCASLSPVSGSKQTPHTILWSPKCPHQSNIPKRFVHPWWLYRLKTPQLASGVFRFLPFTAGVLFVAIHTCFRCRPICRSEVRPLVPKLTIMHYDEVHTYCITNNDQIRTRLVTRIISFSYGP